MTGRIVAKRQFVVWAASLLFLGNSLAQEGSYQIFGVRARIRIFPPSRTVLCLDTLLIRPRKGTDTISLGLPPACDLEVATVDGKRADSEPRDGRLVLSRLPDDTALQVVLGYSLSLLQPTEFSLLGEDRAVLRDVETLPRGPSSLRSVRLSVIVPPAWDAIAVGALVARDSSADSTVYVWQFDQPLNEIGWICAGQFRTFDAKGGTVPLSLNLFQHDSSAPGNLMHSAEDILNFYGRRFSPYRFPKLSIVEIDDGIAGRNVLAISGPSFIMVKRLAFETEDAFNRVETILPHEIAHQWWPLTVFIDDQDAAFLSEGMCEYSDRLYREGAGGLTVRDSLGRHPLLRPLILRMQEGHDIPLQGKVDLRTATTQYLKGAYVHQMLRRIVGDSVFFRLYREYAQRFSMKKASLDDFRAIAEELSGKQLQWFFDQWVKNTGAPRLRIYNVKRDREAAEWIVRGRVRLVGYDKFSDEVPVSVQTRSGVVAKQLWIGSDTAGMFHNDVPFEIRTGAEPLSVSLDPQRETLEIRKLPPRFSDLREPGDGIMIIGSPDPGALLSLARNDSARLAEAGWSITLKADSAVSLQDLQQERVFLYGRSSENGVVRDAEGKFPMQLRHDSVLAENQILGGRTLALLQAIENPFLPQAVLCWIAPLSERAHPDLLPYDSSWILLNGSDVISSGTWDLQDDDHHVEFKP